MATRPVAKVAVDLAANSAQFTTGLAKADAALASSARQWQKHMSDMDAQMASVMATVKGGIAALAGGVGVAELSRSLFDVNSRFQDLHSGLETAMGSAKGADIAFAGIREFAKQTPYELAEVVTAFTRLKNLGLDPANEALTAWGDMASSFPNKTLTDVIEAVADATTGEFERLKEFGIKASTQGDKVAFTFKGVTTTVSKTADAIDAYLRKLSADNFGGAMDRRMANLSGLASNLKDSFDDLLVTIGLMGANRALEEMLKGLNSAISTTADNMGTVANVGGAAAAAIGGIVVARTAATAIAAFQAANISAVAGLSMLNTFGTATAARMVAMAAATGTASLAMRGLTAALALIGGPVGASIAAASAAIYLMATHQSAAEEASVAHGRAMSAFNGIIDISKGKVKDLTAEVKALRKAQLEAASDAVKSAITQQEVYARAGNFKIDRVAFETGMSKQDAEALVAPVRDLQKAYLDGSISASELFSQTSALADQEPRLKPLAQAMAEWAAPLSTAKQELKEIEAALAVLNGTATDTQKALVLPSVAAKATSTGPSDAEKKKAESIAKQIQQLQFQEAQLSRTSREQFIYNEVQKSGAAATSEAGQRVAAAAGSFYDASKSAEAANAAMERLRQSEADTWDQALEQTKARDKIAAGVQQEVADNEKLIAAYKVSETQYEQTAAALELLNQYRQAGITLTPEETAQVEAYAQTLGKQRTELDAIKAKHADMKQMGTDVFHAIGTAAEDAILKMEGIRSVAAALLQDIGRIFLRMAVTKNIEGIAGKLFSNFSFGNLFGSGSMSQANASTADTLAFYGEFAEGGKITGPGTGRSDSILAAVSNGEYIVNAEAARRNAALLDAINNGRLPRFADGGMVGRVSPALSASNLGGGKAGGDQYFIDARGADKEGLARLEAAIRATNASVERRAVAAVGEAVGRDRTFASKIRSGR